MQLSCNKLPNNSPINNNPPSESSEQQDPPDSDVEIWGHLSNDEYDIINTHTVNGGEFIFKEKKYEFQGNNLVIADVKNETENNYTLVVHCSYFDEAGAQVFTESRTYEGWAAGYTQPILFLPMMAFDSYEYSIEVQPYDGVCFGLNYNIEFAGVNEDRFEAYPGLFGMTKETNKNTSSFWRCGTAIIWDNTGEIHNIYTIAMQIVDQQIINLTRRHIMTIFKYETPESSRPSSLTGDLRCVIIPYFHTDIYELQKIADFQKLYPDVPLLDPHVIQ